MGGARRGDERSEFDNEAVGDIWGDRFGGEAARDEPRDVVLVFTRGMGRLPDELGPPGRALVMPSALGATMPADCRRSMYARSSRFCLSMRISITRCSSACSFSRSDADIGPLYVIE